MSEEKKKEIPTQEEIATLPRWAQVAFAARCARRVQPLFKHFWPEVADDHVLDLERTIKVAEGAATAAVFHTNPLVVYGGGQKRRGSAETAFSAAYAASAAHASSDAAEEAYNATSKSVDAASTLESFGETPWGEGAWGGGLIGAATIEAMRFDFELLRDAAEREKWTDDTPVAPALFGPIWPFGAPQGWPAPSKKKDESPEPVQLKVEFAIPQELDRDEADRIIGELIERANQLHHAYGGSGLTIVDGMVYETEPALEPVGQGGGF